ncbi:restriction endonuclease subunit S [Geobacter hydrogenophilus]|uniref:Type I restriction-modification enzyme, S subunit n=1 Tax=Geobacter hydrogenophilus TaxID=40983 RepID=A0A9W6LDZ7_9BACT|nr:restriction endonuclease subunit S [Geobacter hydrogenophilus]MBT0895266.1 restriction endonuclease subunit S [Geobacter hydrogenophilus]GLI39495.1 type I restriction-modification enzyme, S subunit [Geobacter hydrogenophilus]
MSDSLPAGWVKEPLCVFASTEPNSFVDGPFGSDLKVSDYTEDGIRILQLQNLGDGHFINENVKYTSKLKAASLSRCLVKPGDLLIAKMADPLARACIVPDNVEQGLIVADLIKLRLDRRHDSTFIAASINGAEFRREAERLSTGTTRTRISLSTLKRIHLKAPSAPDEQKKIGDIIRTLDEAIEQTEALIAKMQQVKAGLMHDLFIRGVTPDGCLRPSREQAPDLYKESPLGWIPKEWNCLPVDQLLAKTACPMRSGPFGSALLKDELVEEGIPLLGIDNIFVERFAPRFHRFVTERKFQELSRYSVFPRDVIITIMGTVGRCCVVPNGITKALSSKHIWTMTFDTELVIPELVCWQLNHAHWVKDWFARHSQGAVMEAIQSSTLRTLRLPIPPIEEQKKILDRYLSANQVVENEEKIVSKLSRQKNGLMHDLLSGRVQANPGEAQ